VVGIRLELGPEHPRGPGAVLDPDGMPRAVGVAVDLGAVARAQRAAGQDHHRLHAAADAEDGELAAPRTAEKGEVAADLVGIPREARGRRRGDGLGVVVDALGDPVAAREIDRVGEPGEVVERRLVEVARDGEGHEAGRAQGGEVRAADVEAPLLGPHRHEHARSPCGGGGWRRRHVVLPPRDHRDVPLTLVVGPANAAKAGEVFGAFRAALPARPLLVVPTRADVAHYERELAEDGAILGGRVTAFGGLVREIAARTGLEERPLGAVARERVVAGAIRSVRLGALARSAGSPGFRDAAGALFGELAEARVAPERLAAAVRERGRAPREAAELYAAYRRRLEALGRDDEVTFAWRVADGLRTDGDAWRATPVLLYGFDDLSRVQRDLVEALAGPGGAEVTVSLPYEPRAAFAGRLETFEELRPLLSGPAVALEAREDFYAAPVRAALHHLERGLWSDGAGRVEAGGAVRVLESAGERAEAELLALECRDLVAGGLAPEDIAVVFRSPRRVAPLLERVLGSVGLALSHDQPVLMRRTAFGRGLLGLLRAATSADATPASLVAWLRTPGVVARAELVDALERDIRRRRIGDVALARERWREIAGWDLDELDRLARAARAGGGPLVAAVGAAAERLWVGPHRGRAPVLGGAEAVEARAYGAVAAALRELAALAVADAEAVSAAGVEDVLAALEARAGDPPRPGAVELCDPLGIRARRFRAVLVAGLQEGEFPRRPRPEPFLSDELRRELAGEGIRLATSEDGGLAEERYLFYACASRASEVLVLSVRTADEEGNPALPSPFLEDVKSLFGELRTRRRTLADVAWPPGTDPDAPAPDERPLGPLRSSAVRALARHGAVMSAGAVEAYAACPVRWLVEKELQPDGLDPDPDAFARGAWIHDVLEATHAELRRRTGTARVTPGNRGEAETILHVELAARRDELDAALPAVTAAAVVAAAEADLRRYLVHSARAGDSRFEPTHLEFGFGMEGDEHGPLVLGSGPDAVRVCGRIDRIDVDPEGRAVVRDYKSGRARPDMAGANWRKEGTLQVALYMLAARDLLGLVPAGGLYQPLRGNGRGERRPRGMLLDLPEHDDEHGYVKNDRVTAEELAAELERIEEDVAELGRRLRAGDLTPIPESCAFRGGCAYPGVCRSTAA
jgi:PD-(D/E)XK nuclease superfamily protein